MYYRAFWQRSCRAAAAGAVLKPLGGNCTVLPKDKNKSDTHYQVSLCWWELVDSNDFAPLLSAKILTSAAKKVPYPCTFYWMGDFNLRGVNQKCGQKCGQTTPPAGAILQFDRTPSKRDFSLPRTGSKVKPQLQNTPL